MTPTEALRNRLRKLLDERIPEGGSDADSRFLDEDMDEILLEATNVYEAAAMGWTMKAGMYQSEMGDVERMTLGQETEQLVSLQERLTYALTMAEKYASMAKVQTTGGVMLRIKPPEVLQ